MKFQYFIIVSMLFAFAASPSAQENESPKPPSDQVPDLIDVKTVIFCGDCDQPFDFPTHKEVLKNLVSNAYIGELRTALYRQDIIHQFQSKAHFDNCDFNNAIDYIDTLLTEIDEHVVVAKVAQDTNNTDDMSLSAKKAFFALGQALHGIQDFYAHTNYVELSVNKVKKSTEIDVIAPWRPAGKQRIKELIEQGLVSGFVFWGFPQKCASDTPSHADLAKDKATTKSGAIKVAHLQNRNQYQIAVQLAREASQIFVDDAFKRWPLLKEVNGKYVAFEIFVDRREF